MEKDETAPIKFRQDVRAPFRVNGIIRGVPMVCAELIGVPRALWGFVLIFALPAQLLATPRRHQSKQAAQVTEALHR